MIKQIFSIFFVILLVGMISAEHPLPTDLVNDTSGMLIGIGDWANNVTYGAYWMLLLLGFCIVLFISASRWGNVRAFGFAGTTGMLGAIILLIIGWIPWYFASAFIVVGAISIVVMSVSRG